MISIYEKEALHVKLTEFLKNNIKSNLRVKDPKSKHRATSKDWVLYIRKTRLLARLERIEQIALASPKEQYKVISRLLDITL